MVLYSKQPQPMNFNHALHLDPEKVDGIEGDTETEKCLSCHQFRDDGTFAGIPKLEKCMECHDDPESPLGDTPEEKELKSQYLIEKLASKKSNFTPEFLYPIVSSEKTLNPESKPNSSRTLIDIEKIKIDGLMAHPALFFIFILEGCDFDSACFDRN